MARGAARVGSCHFWCGRPDHTHGPSKVSSWSSQRGGGRDKVGARGGGGTVEGALTRGATCRADSVTGRLRAQGPAQHWSQERTGRRATPRARGTGEEAWQAGGWPW